MADTSDPTPTDDELTLDEATLEHLEVPELEEPPDLEAGEAQASAAPADPDAPAEPARESREQELSRRLREQEALSAQLARDLVARNQPPPQHQQHPQAPWSHLPEQQRQAWEQSAPIVRAIFQEMIGPVLQPLVPAIQRANEATERMSLRNARTEQGGLKYADAAEYEEVASQMRWQHYQQTGQWQPLELAYLVAKGAGLVRQPPAPVRAAAARTATKRGQAARTVAGGAVTPGQGPPPTGMRLTTDRVAAMSDEEILNLGVRAGIPRLRLQRRGVA
jgi:hypothetical protein